MHALLERLRDHWLSQNLEISPGASEAEVAAFEREHNVALPPLFREYLRELNGLANNDSDDELIFFWPIARIVSDVRDFSARYGASGSGCFVFADWSISCHDFVICLSPEPQESTPILVTYSTLQPVAASFSEFIERYLQGDQELLFPQPLPSAAST